MGKSKKTDLLTPSEIQNEKRFYLIQKTQEDCQQHHDIHPEVSGVVVTTFIGIIRKSITLGNFEEFCLDLFNICKVHRGDEIEK